MRRIVGIVLLMLGTALLFSRSVFAQAAENTPTRIGRAAIQIDPRADSVLRRMTDYFGTLPAFSCRVASSLGLSSKASNGASSHFVTKMSVRFARPNRLALVVDEGTMGVTVVSDGRQFVQYLPALKRYVVSAAPPDFRGMMYTGAPNSITMLGTADAVIPLSGPEFYRNLMGSVTRAEYLSQEKVSDAVCHHCRCAQEDFDWDIWIDAGKLPLVRKVALDLAKYAKSGPQMPDTQIDYAVTFADWNVNPTFAAADFTFVPPAGAQRVAELIEASATPVNPLVGKPAPQFRAVAINGDPIDSNAYLGKKVVLLAFWTTFGTNCSKTLAEEEAVAQHYAEKGVVFLPINLGEKAADVKVFLEQNKVASPVLLDARSEVAGVYQVQSIPHTVLIGADGRVQVVHIGYHPNLTKILSNDIEAVLAGKDMASETLRRADEAARKNSQSGKASSDQPGVKGVPTTP